MNFILKFAILLAGVWATYVPAVYGALFMLFLSPWAIIDFVVLCSCIIVVWREFKPLALYLWIAALIIIFFASTIGIFHHFQDSGESGPLAFEWLNGYYKNTLPMISLVLLKFIFQWLRCSSKDDNEVNENA